MVTLTALFWISTFSICIYLAIKVFCSFDLDWKDDQFKSLFMPGILCLVILSGFSLFGLVFAMTIYFDLFHEAAFSIKNVGFVEDWRFYFFWGATNLFLAVGISIIGYSRAPGFKE